MNVSRVSAKGQVTIPKVIRERLNLREGDRVAFIEERGKVILTKASVGALVILRFPIGNVRESSLLVPTRTSPVQSFRIRSQHS